MGYDLQVYRNFLKDSTTIGKIQEKTGALRVIVHIDEAGIRHQDPSEDHQVDEGEAVVLLMSVMTAPIESSENNDEFILPKDLRVGIPAIDEEHRTILTLVHRLDAAGEDKFGNVAREVLLELRDYTVKHFKHEEALFLSSGYPEADFHIAEHRALTKKVNLLIEENNKMHKGNLKELLENWIRHHIMEVDNGYVNHLKGNVAEPVVSATME